MTSSEQRRRRWLAVLAFAVYCTLSIGFFARPLLYDPRHFGMGKGPDPTVYMWLLVWWPYSIWHRLNPFLPTLVFSPSGYNLNWSTSMPGAALLAFPMTWIVGPFVSQSVLSLISLPLAAVACFLLCQHLSGAFWPSLFGGYIFGFSSYMLAQLVGHLPLLLIFPVPLAILIVLYGIQESLSPVKFVSSLTPILFLQYSFSSEIFATTSLFGAVTLACALVLFPASTRARIIRLLPWIALSYVLTAIILAPVLYSMFRNGIAGGTFPSIDVYSTDVLNLAIPTPVTVLGNHFSFPTVSARFSGNFAESGSYLGLPLIAIFAIVASSRHRTPAYALLVVSALVVTVASMGPKLHIAGTPTVPLPWTLFRHVPLLDKALPIRFTMMAFLALGIMVSLFLAEPSQRLAKYLLVILAVLTLAPDLNEPHWQTEREVPAFFSQGYYAKVLSPDETVLILPYGASGDSMRWQAETQMYFKMAGGYLGPLTTEYSRWPIVHTLLLQVPQDADTARQLQMFLQQHHVDAIVVTRSAFDNWKNTLAELKLTAPLEVSDVLFYRLSPRQSNQSPISSAPPGI